MPTRDSSDALYQAAQRVAQARPTPFLLIDKKIIREKYEQLRRALEEAEIFYALKANPHHRIATLFRELGSGFEISSEGELDLLLRLNVPPQRIISSNPIKSEAFIRAAFAAGVNQFTFDSSAEVEKLWRLAPQSKVLLRLSVSNEGSQWPLNRKFGIEIEEGVFLLKQASRRGLQPYGITFHVGSQCTDAMTWVKAIDKTRAAWDLVSEAGITLKQLNIGGGFPIPYVEPIPSIIEISQIIKEAIEKSFPQGLEIAVEPGRYLVGEAGILVTTVIAKAVRNGQNWLYLDIGVFNGLMESLGNIKYLLRAARNTSAAKWVLAGPSCDSFDVIASEVELPELEIGDKVYILSAGAYTTAYASKFNGFTIPPTFFCRR